MRLVRGQGAICHDSKRIPYEVKRNPPHAIVPLPTHPTSVAMCANASIVARKPRWSFLGSTVGSGRRSDGSRASVGRRPPLFSIPDVAGDHQAPTKRTPIATLRRATRKRRSLCVLHRQVQTSPLGTRPRPLWLTARRVAETVSEARSRFGLLGWRWVEVERALSCCAPPRGSYDNGS
jgi:hypothetical protein